MNSTEQWMYREFNCQILHKTDKKCFSLLKLPLAHFIPILVNTLWLAVVTAPKWPFDRQWAIDLLICTVPHRIAFPFPGCPCRQLCVVFMNNVLTIWMNILAGAWCRHKCKCYVRYTSSACATFFCADMAKLSVHSNRTYFLLIISPFICHHL